MALVGGTAVLAAVSLSWAVTVDSIPADERPYIGSSETNSVLELAFGYNGLSRLTGQQNTGNRGMSNAMGAGNERGDRSGRLRRRKLTVALAEQTVPAWKYRRAHPMMLRMRAGMATAGAMA